MNRAFLLTGLLIATSSAFAGYRVVDLGPDTLAEGFSHGQVVGSTVFAQKNVRLATSWDFNGFPTYLHPAFLGGGSSLITASQGKLAVGQAFGSTVTPGVHAVVWEGNTVTLLQAPNGMLSPTVYGTDGTNVVGLAYVPGTNDEGQPILDHSEPIVWNPRTGTATSLSRSNNGFAASGVWGNQQVGWELTGNFAEARLWTGTANSMVDLHPNGFDVSQAVATNGTTQVGTASVDVRLGEAHGGVRVRYDSAVIWHGTSESVEFLPTPFTDTFAQAISGNTVVGYGQITTSRGVPIDDRAMLWDGPFNNLVMLHDVLGKGWTDSRATAIDADGNVAGWARFQNGVTHGILWVRTP